MRVQVPCPEVLLLREHVLLMRFIGYDGLAAPRLKDAKLTPSQAANASKQVALLLRAIYHDCKLVHGDFSEYNLLWYDGTVYVIDVSPPPSRHAARITRPAARGRRRAPTIARRPAPGLEGRTQPCRRPSIRAPTPAGLAVGRARPPERPRLPAKGLRERAHLFP
eukprot:6455114-Prymnesium_polylepis.1